MKIIYQTKEESNRQQIADFIGLSKQDRLIRFFELSKCFMQFPTKNNVDKTEGNYILTMKKNEVLAK
jgi:hypothetical protein